MILSFLVSFSYVFGFWVPSFFPNDFILVQNANNRIKDVEICVPIVYGTIAFYLGRKASE